jgi:hypothetical protein
VTRPRKRSLDCATLLLLLLCIAPQVAGAKESHFDVISQQATLVSLEGDSVHLDIVYYEPADQVAVGGAGIAPLCIHDVRGEVGDPVVTILGGKFLVLTYGQICGTGCSTRAVVILCVGHDRLYKSFQATSYHVFNLTEVYVPAIDSLHLFDEHGEYRMELVSIDSLRTGYQLTVREHNWVQSKHDPYSNADTSAVVDFTFDERDRIFYNHVIDIDGDFRIRNWNLDSIGIRSIHDTKAKAARAKLNQEELVFWQDAWCRVNPLDSTIVIDSSRCTTHR